MQNDNELVTIGIPVYNMEDSIINAIKSCLSQTYKNIEILVVDDGSKDNSIAAIKNNFSDSRVHIYMRKQNGGVCAAMRDIVEQAQGKYICFLDADDTMMEDRVEKQYMAIKTAEQRYPSKMVASFCGSIVNDLTAKKNYSINPNDLWDSKSKHPFGGGTGHSMYKAEDLRRLGNFDLRFSRSADSAMCLLFLMNGGFYAMVEEPLITYNFCWNKDKEKVAINERDVFLQIRNEIRSEAPSNIYLRRYLGDYSYEILRRSTIKLFGFIPLLKLVYKKNKISCYLFGFIPFIQIKNKTM